METIYTGLHFKPTKKIILTDDFILSSHLKNDLVIFRTLPKPITTVTNPLCRSAANYIYLEQMQLGKLLKMPIVAQLITRFCPTSHKNILYVRVVCIIIKDCVINKLDFFCITV